MAEIDQLKSYAATGEALPITRGDVAGGRSLGFYVLERVQLKHSHLAKSGIGRQQEFVLQLVKVPGGPSKTNLTNLFTGIITLLSQAKT